MDDGALIDGVIRIDHLRRRESEKRVDGDEGHANRITMNGASPLKVMIGGDEERWSNVSFPKGGERTIVGLVN